MGTYTTRGFTPRTHANEGTHVGGRVDGLDRLADLRSNSYRRRPGELQGTGCKRELRTVTRNERHGVFPLQGNTLARRVQLVGKRTLLLFLPANAAVGDDEAVAIARADET